MKDIQGQRSFAVILGGQAGGEGRTPPQLKQLMAKSHSFAVTGPAREVQMH